MRNDIRLALPSKGRLASDTLEFLAACGLKVYRPNPRQYVAKIPALPGVTVMFQRPGDVAIGVQQGTVDFGITGRDVLSERCYDCEDVVILHDELGFSPCELHLAVPDSWADVTTLGDLARKVRDFTRPVRVATKFPKLTGRFLQEKGLEPFELVEVEGTLEIAPAIGYADLIADLVSTGTTLRDNHLHRLQDGLILASEAVLIGSRPGLRQRPDLLKIARQLLEYIEAHLRAQQCFLVFANMRGQTPPEVAQKLWQYPGVNGLQGPTISPVYPSSPNGTGWYAVNIVVKKSQLTPTISALRACGGSGVIVSPVTYIFEEEPERCRVLEAI